MKSESNLIESNNKYKHVRFSESRTVNKQTETSTKAKERSKQRKKKKRHKIERDCRIMEQCRKMEILLYAYVS